MNNQQETEGAAVAPAPKTKKKQSLSISSSMLAFVVVVGAFGYLIYASWQAFLPPATGPEVVAQASPTPKVPELKLNQENKRQAPEITVDENGIGKPNPFQ